MGLTPMPPGRITHGTALLKGIDIIKQKIIGGEDIRGAKIGMIFQDPMSSLNPTMKVAISIAEHCRCIVDSVTAKRTCVPWNSLRKCISPKPTSVPNSIRFLFPAGCCSAQ
jgi:ABC-type dipeptide/oligopeptide/nickel transport system ATPase component